MRRGAAALCLVAGCSPATARPPFAPLPQATTMVLVAEPPVVTREVATLIAAAGVGTTRATELDRYVETVWYEPPADTAGVRFPFRVKTRVWADPAGSGRTQVWIETVYRPIEDPSRPPRDLELLTPPAGDPLGRRLVAALREKYEVL